MDIVSLTRNLFAGAVLFAVCAAEAAEQKPLLDYDQNRGWVIVRNAFPNPSWGAGFRVQQYNGKYKPMKNFVFDGGDSFDGTAVHASDMRALKKLYIENFGPSFIKRVRAFSSVCGLRAESLSFKSYRRLWGCCDGRNNITFNYKLLMLPKVLQDYVAAHELCHTVFHDHSPSFHGC